MVKKQLCLQVHLLNTDVSPYILLLKAAEQLGETEKLCLLVEELGGLDRLEMLQNHDNDMVYQAAHGLIERFFADVSDYIPN